MKCMLLIYGAEEGWTDESRQACLVEFGVSWMVTLPE